MPEDGRHGEEVKHRNEVRYLLALAMFFIVTPAGMAVWAASFPNYVEGMSLSPNVFLFAGLGGVVLIMFVGFTIGKMIGGRPYPAIYE